MWKASGGEAPMEKKLYYKANEVSEILGMDGIKEIFDNINQTTEKNVDDTVRQHHNAGLNLPPPPSGMHLTAF